MKIKNTESLPQFKNRLIQQVEAGKITADKALSCYEKAYFAVEVRELIRQNRATLTYY
jgi:hypothetical protein